MEDEPVAEAVEIFEPIIKSENDDRSYRGLKVHQIKMLLISDPTTEKGAAALDVNIGSISDPDNMSGLAQLLQHVLYLTNKSTQQRYFQTYIEENSGSIKYELNEDHSTYYFDISVTKFKDALKRFADIFAMWPNFENEVVISEMNNICNMSDLMRKPNGINNLTALSQLFKWTINCDHRMSKCGYDFINEDEYLTRVIYYLKMFYQSHYYAHNMSLCVLSKESLDELQKWVIEFFSGIRAKDATIIPLMKLQRWRPLKFTSAYKIWCAPYDKNLPYTRIYIVFPTEKFKNYRYTIALQHFFAYLFKYEGKESFLSVLKTKGWGYFLDAKNLSTSLSCALFGIGIDLTDEGLKHIDDIMTLFIQYVKMLKECDGSKLRRIYNEYKEIMEIKFHRLKEKKSIINVAIISKELQYAMNMKDILCLKYVPIVNSGRIIKAVINDFLSSLCLRIYIISEEYNNCTEELEPWYNYKYKKEIISMRTWSNWMNNQCAILSLPACNEFIPTRFNIKPSEDNVEEKNPTIIWNTQFVKLWHKKDDKFNIPEAIMKFHFISPIAYENSFNANLMRLFLRLINNSLSEYLWPAASVGLHWKIVATMYGMQLDIFGYDNKQYILLEKIVDRIINFQLNPEHFEIDKQNHIQFCATQLNQLENRTTSGYAIHYLSMALNNYLLPSDEILKPTKEITFEKVQQFISDLFSSMYVECLIYGNKTRAEALEIAHLIDNKLSDGIPLIIPYFEMHHDFKYEPRHNIKFNTISGAEYLAYTEKKKFPNSFAQLFYQINDRSIQSNVFLNFIRQIISKPLNELRTDKSWSNRLDTDVYKIYQKQILNILIIHLKLDQHHVIRQVMHCMENDIKEHISRMSEEKFQENKQLLADIYDKNKPKTLDNASAAFWAEIMSQEYNFDRIDDELKCLEEITKTDLCTFFEGMLISTKKAIFGNSIDD